MSELRTIVLFPALAEFLALRGAEFDQIPESRKAELTRLSAYTRDCLRASDTARLTFICTHNSRRSHLSQIWAKVAADAQGLTGVLTFSGGTEATAMNPRVAQSLRRSGFRVETADSENGISETGDRCAGDRNAGYGQTGGRDTENPIYLVHYSDDVEPLRCFSKVHDQAPNPAADYCAVMTCSTADEACPIVAGCDLRLPIRYDDPKVADDTPQEAEVYDARSRQICREMLYMITRVQPV